MKKRKTPILLLSLLLVLVSAVVVFGMSQGKTSAKPDEPDKPTASQDAPTADSVANSIRANAPKGGPPKQMIEDSSQGPSIALSKPGMNAKPRPETNGTTNSQWYTH
jgi:hypothetical protein